MSTCRSPEWPDAFTAFLALFVVRGFWFCHLLALYNKKHLSTSVAYLFLLRLVVNLRLTSGSHPVDD